MKQNGSHSHNIHQQHFPGCSSRDPMTFKYKINNRTEKLNVNDNERVYNIWIVEHLQVLHSTLQIPVEAWAMSSHWRLIMSSSSIGSCGKTSRSASSTLTFSLTNKQYNLQWNSSLRCTNKLHGTKFIWNPLWLIITTVTSAVRHSKSNPVPQCRMPSAGKCNGIIQEPLHVYYSQWL